MNMFKALWCEVLLQQILDALYGARGSDIPKKNRALLTRQARAYLTTPSRDFNNVCYLIGVDPEAARERLSAAINKAPSPEELADNPLPLPEFARLELGERRKRAPKGAPQLRAVR